MDEHRRLWEQTLTDSTSIHGQQLKVSNQHRMHKDCDQTGAGDELFGKYLQGMNK